MNNFYRTALTGILLLLAGHAGAQTAVAYIERSWNAETKQVVAQQKTISSYLELKNSMLNNGWLGVGSDYGDDHKWCVVEDKLEVLTLNVQGEAHLILKDGAQLICTGGVRVEKNSSLTIYAQSDGDNCGKLEATNSEYSGYAGIGSAADMVDASGNGIGMGTLVIHGGVVSATGNSGGAGIGGGENRGFESDGGVTIYGGKVTANGDSGGAGITVASPFMVVRSQPTVIRVVPASVAATVAIRRAWFVFMAAKSQPQVALPVPELVAATDVQPRKSRFTAAT